MSENRGPWQPSSHPVDQTWWRAADGWYYPPQAHPNYHHLIQQTQAEVLAAPPADRAAGKGTTTWTGVEKFTVFRLVIFGFVAFGGIGAVWAAVGAGPDDIVSSRTTWIEKQVERSLTPLRKRKLLGLTVTERTDVAAGDGKVVFADGLADPTTAWNVQEYRDGASVGYRGGGYEMQVVEQNVRWEFAPHDESYQQLAVSVDATFLEGPPADVAVTTSTPPADATDDQTRGSYGLVCAHGPESAFVTYRFAVSRSGAWRLVLHRAEESPLIVKAGAIDPPGPNVQRLTFVCAHLDDGTQRLVGFVGAEPVVDLIDDFEDGSAWYGGVTAGGPVAVRFGNYEQRNLGG